MRISSRVSALKPSATLTINAKAQELKAEGRKIISLAVGEPDFPTPAHVCEAAVKAINEGFTRYTPVPGIPALRQAVADYYKKFYGLAAVKEQVILCNGGKQALYNLFQALLEPGDEVLLTAPYWVSYPPMIELAGGKPVVVPTRAEDGFLAGPGDFEPYLTERSRLLLLNTPSNPTGAHYSQRALDDIAAWALSKKLFIISDEVYDRLVYSPARASTLCGLLATDPENIAVVGALSKTFMMTGWRVGSILADNKLIKAVNKLQGQSTSNICSIAQKAALAALTGPMDDFENMLKVFADRRDKAYAIISQWPDVVCPKPDGAFYLFPKISAYYTPQVPDSTALCALILDRAGVALVPGEEFGDAECIRFSYALDEETLLTAVKAVGDVLMGLRK